MFFTLIKTKYSYTYFSFSPDNVINESLSTSWVFEVVAEEWSRWLPSSTKDTIKKGGYYTTLVKTGFRIISLNNIACYTPNL